MQHLPPEWAEHLESGVSQRLAGAHADGRPTLCRSLAARALPDGRIEVLAAAAVAADVLSAIAATRRVACVAGRPDTGRSLHLKGDEAELFSPTEEDAAWFERCGRRFIERLLTLRADADLVVSPAYHWAPQALCGVRFTLRAAFDQTPGPGAGQALPLLHVDGPALPSAAIEAGMRVDASARPAGPPLTLVEARRLLEGVVPPSLCSVGADGMPHLNFISHAEYVDEDHVALTYQFLNRSRVNVLATGRVALQVDDPMGGAGVVLDLRYRRTETEGPLFERMRIKLAGIAAHTGMDKVFHLRGADVYRVESLRQADPRQPLPSVAPRCELAAGVRRLSQQLADAPDLGALLQAFTDGLQRELAVRHAIVWLLDEQQQSLYTLASVGYPQPGTGAEMPVSDAGLVGVALRENVPIRIGQVCQMLRAGLAARARVEQLGLQAATQELIPLPGLAVPCSQLAVPLRARGRSVGALLLESEHDQFFGYDDEDALTAIASQLAQGLAALHAAELAEAPGGPARAGQRTPSGKPPLRIRHHARDHTVFVDDQYLIKGVAGAIVAKLVRDQIASGSDAFSTRGLRLAAEELRLPDVQDNLGVRLLMLERRLAERDVGLRIERCGRGLYRLVADGPLILVAAD